MLVAAIAVFALVIAVMRRNGWSWHSPPVLLAIYLVAFLPLRGLAFDAMLGDPFGYGLGPRVAYLADTGWSGRANTAVLILAVSFAIGVALALIVGRPNWHEAKFRAMPSATQNRALTLCTVPGLALTAAASNPRGAWLPIPSALVQIAGAATIIFFAVLTARVAAGQSVRWPAAAAAVLGAASASKDLLLQLTLALLIGYGLRQGFRATRRRRRRLRPWIAGGLLTIAAVTIVIPAVEEVRVHQTPVVTAIRETSSQSVPSRLEFSCIFLTNRLHGYDSVLASLPNEGQDPAFSITPVLKAPAALVTSAASVVGSNDLGTRFATLYWGADPSTDVSVAPTYFGQAILSTGLTVAVVIAALLGFGSVVLSIGTLNHSSPQSLLVWSVLVRAPFYLERDIVSTTVSLGRALLLLGALWIVLSRLSGRQQLVPPRAPRVLNFLTTRNGLGSSSGTGQHRNPYRSPRVLEEPSAR